MRILFFLRYFRDQASSRVRGFYIAEELKRRGISCNILYGYGKKLYLRFLLDLIRYDIIYFQKRYSEVDLRLSKSARLVGRETIFDIDDSPSGVGRDPEAAARAIEMMKNCSAAVVGSHKLLDSCTEVNPSTYLVPSCVNLDYYKPRRRDRNRGHTTLGWIGNGINYKYDLLMLLRPLENLSARYDLRLTLIGALEQMEIHEAFSGLMNMEVQIIDSLDWADPMAVPAAISDFDIGLYPLLDNEYNKYKGGFKALEYMAMEIPVVASPVGEAKLIVQDGRDGFLVSNKMEWEDKLSYLVQNASARERMGKEGRDKVERHYSTQLCATRLMEIFENPSGRL